LQRSQHVMRKLENDLIDLRQGKRISNIDSDLKSIQQQEAAQVTCGTKEEEVKLEPIVPKKREEEQACGR
jgi:hypothetical protein